jgi:glycosyltransferase involved in cell wall biosynthesis
MTGKKELVSVVITTKNEEKNIENCLLSLKYQTYKNIEIIVVDNNSTDNTKEITKKYTKKFYDKGPERSAQRNFGMIEKSNGKFVMFLDADMILSPSAIESCINAIKDNVALHIPEIVLGKNYFSKVRRFERTFYNGTAVDGARFFLKSAFIKVKGFDEKLNGPEDWDIDKKIKQIGKIGLVEEKENIGNWKMKDFILDKGVNPKDYGVVIYHNESEFDLKKYISKKGYYAKTFDDYIKKWGKHDEDIKKQFGFYYRFFGVFVEKGKWRKLLLHPLLTFGVYYLRFLVGIKFLWRKSEI